MEKIKLLIPKSKTKSKSLIERILRIRRASSRAIRWVRFFFLGITMVFIPFYWSSLFTIKMGMILQEIQCEDDSPDEVLEG